jgi:transposase
VGCTPQAVRDVIRAFNTRGLDVLRRGAPHPGVVYSAFDSPRAEALRDLLHQSPRLFAKPTSVWTLNLAAAVAYEQGLTARRVSGETIRATLARMGVRWQRAKEWITSPDPEYARKKARRDRLIRLAQRQTVARDDPDPKALACYGLLARSWDAQGQRTEELWLRFVAGRPVSAVTIAFLTWCAARAAERGKRAVLLIWDNASWHDSQIVRTWVHQYNRQVKQVGHGVRLLMCFLPSKSPWLNPIEPKWLHGKRKVVEPDRLLTAAELADRVCAIYGCIHEPHLITPKKAA